MTQHVQVTVQHPQRGTVQVDEGLADLLTALWTLGIDTLHSCQAEHQGGRTWSMVFILFPSSGDVEDFLEYVAPFQEPEQWSLYERIRSVWGVPGAWRFSARVDDLAVTYEAGPGGLRREARTGSSEFEVAVGVRFPLEDLAAVRAAIVGTVEARVGKTPDERGTPDGS